MDKGSSPVRGATADRQTAVMSTPRRTLGTGPRSESKAELAIPAPRLLPAERAEQEQLLVDDVEQESARMLRGRRNLGPGITETPEGVVRK
jgi:hypothetical protein